VDETARAQEELKAARRALHDIQGNLRTLVRIALLQL
jgi:hypothetical protein